MNAQSGLRILYIDDDPGIARLVQKSLGKRGYVVEHAAGGAAGIAMLREQRYDLIGLDHIMPGQDGLTVLAEIRALCDPPPVIYVTGSEDSKVAVAALKAGAADYVWKDMQGHFLELLDSTIGNALAQEALRRAKEKAEHEMREARDYAESMLREVNHRVSNSLSLVAALVRMQSAAVADPGAREALGETQARIMAIAGIHRRLYTSEDVRFVEIDAYLAGLVEELEAAMRASQREHPIRLHAEAIRVPTDKAVSLGVIVTELVTNAYKYAYPQGLLGDIRVRISQADGQVALVVEDDGIGWQGRSETRGTGLGTRIVAAMASNLRTTVTFDPDFPGTRVSVAFAI